LRTAEYARNLDVRRQLFSRLQAEPPAHFITRETSMSAFDDHKEEIEHYEQMLGVHRGRLAVTLDRVTNAMVLVGQHGVYCHSQRDPAKPTMDIQIITDELRKAKELIQSVMEDLRAERENRLRTN
jgi:hypothetical protein